MTFGVRQIPPQVAIDQGGYFGQFLIMHALDECLDEPVIRKLLQIINDRVLIGFAIRTETDQTLIGLNEVMAVYIHFSALLCVRLHQIPQRK